MHEVKDLRVSDARKRREIFERNKLLVEEKMRKSQAAVERKVREKEKHTVSIINWCLWQTEAQVEVEVVQLTTKRIRKQHSNLNYASRSLFLNSKLRSISLLLARRRW